MMPGIGINYGLGCYLTLKTLESIRAFDPDMDIRIMHKLYLDAGPGCYDRILASAKREYGFMQVIAAIGSTGTETGSTDT